MFGLFDNSGRKIASEMKKNEVMYQNMLMPNLQDVDFTPEMVDYSLVNEDPMVLYKQLHEMEQLKKMANDGLSAEDVLSFAKGNRMAADRGRRASQAALQNAEARGVAGSGLEFAMREIGNQEATEQARMAAMEQAAATARQRAMNQMAYNQNLAAIRDQDRATKAQNTGIINQFNAMNTGNSNQARLRNIDQRRDNEQQRFNNRMARADGVSGARKGLADAHAAKGAADAQGMNSLMQLGGTLAMGAMFASDERLKHKVRYAGDSIDETLESMSPFLWEYKNPAFGEGEYVGVMAQDLQKSPVGKQMIEETPQGLMVNANKMLSFLMGTVVHQQRKIKQLEAKLG